jgi:hypothetical protein
MTALLNSACKSADIILIQEVNITDPRYEVTHPNFLFVKPPKGQRRSNRTAGYISRSNPFLQVTQCTDMCNNPDLQVLEVSTPLIPSFLLLNIYNEHHPESRTYTIPRALTPLTLPPRCIITGDLNAHHVLWNSRVTTPRRAEALVLLIEEQGWHLLNIPDIPTYWYKNGQGTSVLDLTLASPIMPWEATNWAVDDAQGTGSDHEVIHFEVMMTIPNPTIATPQSRLNWSRTEWDSFSDTLHSLSTSTQSEWECLRLDPTLPHLGKWAEML